MGQAPRQVVLTGNVAFFASVRSRCPFFLWEDQQEIVSRSVHIQDEKTNPAPLLQTMALALVAAAKFALASSVFSATVDRIFSALPARLGKTVPSQKSGTSNIGQLAVLNGCLSICQPERLIILALQHRHKAETVEHFFPNAAVALFDEALHDLNVAPTERNHHHAARL